jgi:hypothetical protein
MAIPKKKPTSYSDFTLTDLKDMFGIENQQVPLRFQVNPIAPPTWLVEVLEIHKSLPKGTQKAKSELLITPVLSAFYQMNPNEFKYFSGYSFDIDPDNALKGRCDYLLSKSLSSEIESPVFGIFEAKDDSIDHYHGQCGSEMYAALLFNQQRNNPISVIHGAVSDGINWQFLRLENKQLWIDTEYYGLQNLPMLLGALQAILDFYD